MLAGTLHCPLKVALIGSGPSAFYTADAYQKSPGLYTSIDMFERLPTPFGLVRGGVAPDHQKIKSVTRVFEKIASHPDFRFFGNVEFGRDIHLDDIRRHYHQAVFATGAGSDRQLHIDGEHLAGCSSASAFVGWYNGHPDFTDCSFPLNTERAIIVGLGNVAIDVARILAKTPEELHSTDIADHALHALAENRIREIVLLARRGPAQAACTRQELDELGALANAKIDIAPEEFDLDEVSAEFYRTHPEAMDNMKLEALRALSKSGKTGGKSIRIRFLVSPVAFMGDDKLARVRIVHNHLMVSDAGQLEAVAGDVYEELTAGMCLTSIGYRGCKLPGLPFDQQKGILPSRAGRIINPETGESLPGLYCTGWIRRGATGIIGTNKPDAQETVQSALQDFGMGVHLDGNHTGRKVIEHILMDRNIRFTTFQDWQKLDEMEVEIGRLAGRPRVKFVRVEDMLDALKKTGRSLVH